MQALIKMGYLLVKVSHAMSCDVDVDVMRCRCHAMSVGLG